MEWKATKKGIGKPFKKIVREKEAEQNKKSGNQWVITEILKSKDFKGVETPEGGGGSHQKPSKK